LPEVHRAAVYYAPARDDALWRAGCAWLGHDPEAGVAVPQPAVPGLEAATAAPRRYGFHATLRPPMRLARGFGAFLADVEKLAARLAVFAMPPFEVADEFGFIALVPAARAPMLHLLADTCVAVLDEHRLAEDAGAQARRAVGRTASQQQNIALWGYPFVFGDFRFHMTLSNAGAGAALLAAARAHFAQALAQPRVVSSLAVFIEPAPGENFRLAARLKLGE
jgi:hypothetical protein